MDSSSHGIHAYLRYSLETWTTNLKTAISGLGSLLGKNGVRKSGRRCWGICRLRFPAHTRSRHAMDDWSIRSSGYNNFFDSLYAMQMQRPVRSFSSKISNSRDSVHANLQSGGSWLIKTNLVSSLWYRNALGSHFNKGKDLFLNFMRKGIWVRALIENWNPRFDNRIVNLNWLESADRN